jgi:hypothetical protein
MVAMLSLLAHIGLLKGCRRLTDVGTSTLAAATLWPKL